jgi:glycosyltransferase involved in cell wall biosynthesis
MRSVAQLADMVFVTVEPLRLPWAKGCKRKLRALVVGSNVGEALGSSVEQRQRNSQFTVAVFGCTEGPRGGEERQIIVQVAARVAEKVHRVRVVAFGRGTAPGEARWPEASGVTVETYGVVPSEHASAFLRNADALLLVRGAVSSRRGSAIAGIAHGLPVVGFASPETGWPITEGGIVFCRLGDVEGLASALVRVAKDSEFAASLRRRSAEVYGRYFSWEAIATRFLSVLDQQRHT